MTLKFVCFFLLLFLFAGCVFEQKQALPDVGFNGVNNDFNSIVDGKKFSGYDPFGIVHDDFLKVDANDFG
jgi:hypothetical protein